MQMASPQLLWLPRLANADSPLLINAFRPQNPPPVPPIYSLPPATVASGGAGQISPPRLNFIPPDRTLHPLQSSDDLPKTTNQSIKPIWSSKNGQKGPFKAIFGSNFAPPPQDPPKILPPPLPPSQLLPLPLHHQSSFTLPVSVPNKQPSRYTYKTNDKVNDDIQINKDHDGAAARSGGAPAPAAEKPPVSARPPHRNRKTSHVHPEEGILLNNHHHNHLSSTTSEEESPGYRDRLRNRKKVRWAGSP
jgi:hypothetical protein